MFFKYRSYSISPAMKRILNRTLFHSLAFIGISSSLLADPIDLSPDGLSDPVSTITFDEVDIADTAPVSAEFAALGATFLPNLNYRTADHPDWQNVEGPNLRTGEPEVNPFSIKFESVLASAAVTLIAQPPTLATITARLNGEDVESIETTISIDNPDNYFGFTNIAFDEIEVDYSLDTRLRVDNIQLGEPAEGFGGRFAITDVARGADGIVDLAWQSIPGELYDVETSGNLTFESWQPSMLAILGEPDPAITTSITVQGPADAAMRYFRVRRLVKPPFLETSFEEGMGEWTVSGDGTQWEFGTPTSGPGAANTGTGVAATGLAGDYIDGTAVQLRTPVIDPGETQRVQLEFAYYLEAAAGDGGQISLLAADGTLLENLEGLYLGGEGNTTEWTDVKLRLPKLEPARPFMVQFAFLSVEGGNPNNGTGWLIDDVRISK